MLFAKTMTPMVYVDMHTLARRCTCLKKVSTEKRTPSGSHPTTCPATTKWLVLSRIPSPDRFNTVLLVRNLGTNGSEGRRMPQTRREHRLLWCLSFPKVNANENQDLSLNMMRIKPRDTTTSMKKSLKSKDGTYAACSALRSSLPWMANVQSKQNLYSRQLRTRMENHATTLYDVFINMQSWKCKRDVAFQLKSRRQTLQS